MKQIKQMNKIEQLNTIGQNNQSEQEQDIQEINNISRSKKIKPVIKTKQVQRQIKRKTKTLGKSAYKMYIAALTAVYAIVSGSSPVSAADFGSSILATGTKSLATDIGKYLLIIAPITGALLGVYFFIRRQAADEMDQKKWNDRIKATIISTLGAVLVSTIIVLIASYYGKTVSTGL
jgi:hypothetical protein